MPEGRCGRNLLLQVRIGGVWTTVSGQQSTAGSLTNEQVDTTSKNEAPARVLVNCGIRSVSLTASGIVRSADDHTWLIEQALSGAIIEARLQSNNFDALYEGRYQISTKERAGDYNNAETYSLTLESAGSLVNANIPVFDALPLTTPNGFAHGHSMRRLSSAYVGPVIRMYRTSDAATFDVPFDNGGNGDFVDVDAMQAFLDGSIVLYSYFWDQSPYTANDPFGVMDLEQTDILQMPYATDFLGNLLLNDAGTPMIGHRIDPSMGSNPRLHLTSDLRNWGPSAVDTVLVFSACQTLEDYQGAIISNGPGAWSLSPKASLEDNEFRFDPDGPEATQKGSMFPDGGQSITGATSDVDNTAIMVNGQEPSLAGVNPQTWGATTVKLGKNATNQFTYRGYNLESIFYYEERAELSDSGLKDTVRAIQENQRDTLGLEW